MIKLDKDKTKLKDVFDSIKDEGIDFAISEALPEVVKATGNLIVDVGMGELFGNIVGAVAPRINSVRLNYKQARLERNINKVINSMANRQDVLEERIALLEQDNKQFLHNVTEKFLDQVVDEIQEKKVDMNINGYIHLLENDNTNEDEALTFFTTLSQLNELDIRILKIYDVSNDFESFLNVKNEYDLSNEQYNYSREKLHRYGLLKSRNEKIRNKNLELLGKYLQDLNRESKKSHPKDVTIPNLKKESRSDSYSITILGSQFLKLIESV